MKKLVLAAVILLGFSAIATAQDAPAIEVFGGYSFVGVDTSTAFSDSDAPQLNLNGWNGSIAINGNRWAGFVADFGGAYGSVEDVDIRLHTIMFGPRITVRKGQITPYFQALFGYARLTAEDQVEVSEYTENDFAMAFGGGVDLNVSDSVSIRAAQLEYFTTKTGLTGDFADHIRFSAGVVFKMGNR